MEAQNNTDIKYSGVVELLTWELINGTLTIRGNGEMPYYGGSKSWETHKKSITSVIIEDGVTNIGYKSFSGCIELASVTIPDSVTNIEDYAFGGCGECCGSCSSMGCTSLTSIIIPKGVTKIAENAFSNCSNLTSFEVDKDNSAYSSENGVLFDKSKTTLLQYPSGKTDTNYIIPNNVTEIEKYAFNECQNLTSIIFPNGVTNIGNNAFADCQNLTSITLPDTVIKIGDEAFKESSLTSIYIPKGVIEVGEDAFGNCSKLTSFDVDNANLIYCSESDVLFNKSKTTLIQYPQAKTDNKEYIIPNSVTIIGKNAFWGCKLHSITIPNSVTTIEKSAIGGCFLLSSIRIPSSVTNIEKNFWGCLSLDNIDVDSDNPVYVSENGVLLNKSKTVLKSCSAGKMGGYIIPDGVVSIEDMAFFCCEYLRFITIPESVTGIGEFAFRGCKKLEHINLQGVTPPAMKGFFEKDTFKEVDKNICILHVPLGSKDKYANAVCWKDFKNIQEDIDNLPLEAGFTWKIENNTMIISSNNTMAEWRSYEKSIVNIIVEEGVTDIRGGFFINCSNLTSITIPSSIKTIGHFAFPRCTNLEHIYLHKENPSEKGHQVFYGVNKDTCVLHVPSGSKDRYAKAEGWQEFKNIQEDAE